ncbi:MAG: GNAT family N-acetyltransferase [Bacteriovoracia bacterium]
MKYEPIEVTEELYLDVPRERDCGAYVEYLKEHEIYRNTLRIPFPYHADDAFAFLRICREREVKLGHPVNWAIRNRAGELIGGIGLADFEPGGHQAEIGYWLGKPHWGRGTMTTVVKALTAFAHRELGLVRITAHVFEYNPKSTRVLEKAGFMQEGRLRKHYRKDGRIFDGFLFAMVFD